MDDWGGESSTDAPLPFKRTSFGAFQTEELYQVYHCNTVAFEALAKQTARLMGKSWWRHQMETFSALLALCAGNSPVAGEFPSQRPVPRSFDVFFEMCLNKWLWKQSRRRWFETPWRSLWPHCNGMGLTLYWALIVKQYNVNAHYCHATLTLQWRYHSEICRL